MKIFCSIAFYSTIIAATPFYDGTDKRNNSSSLNNERTQSKTENRTQKSLAYKDLENVPSDNGLLGLNAATTALSSAIFIILANHLYENPITQIIRTVFPRRITQSVPPSPVRVITQAATNATQTLASQVAANVTGTTSNLAPILRPLLGQDTVARLIDWLNRLSEFLAIQNELAINRRPYGIFTNLPQEDRRALRDLIRKALLNGSRNRNG
ncbi:uncharacterized protein LOC136043098 [Artemia franciscana]|uniref:uncharacterized protein LOC136043098 n=1 Tax=Artemia franciscana TaxID=6661 RepID=UPI0032DB1563